MNDRVRLFLVAEFFGAGLLTLFAAFIAPSFGAWVWLSILYATGWTGVMAIAAGAAMQFGFLPE